MANEQARQILQQGIAAARAGHQAQARQLLQEAVKRDPRSEVAWMWLSSVANDNQERIFCLKQILSINPQNEHAINGLKQLGVIGGSAPAAGQPPAAQAPTGHAPAQAAQGGSSVPVVDDRRLGATMTQLDPILLNYQPVPGKPLPFQWTHKRRGRVGDSSAMVFRAGVIVGVLVILGLLGYGGFSLVSHIPSFAAAPTDTPTAILTPTRTPTATPGDTDTPSPTPRVQPTNTPTYPPEITKGSFDAYVPSPVYPDAGNSRAVRDAFVAMASGNYDNLVPTFQKVQESRNLAKDDVYYGAIYYQVVADVKTNNISQAANLLNDPNNQDPKSAIYNLAIAYLDLVQQNYDKALTEANTAISLDKENKLMVAYAIAGQADIASKQYTDAIRIISTGLEKQPDDETLLLLRGQARMLSGNDQGAIDDANEVLYIDPRNEDGYILRSQALMSKASKINNDQQQIQAYGDAVLATKDFLFYFPGETIAWILLGEAREGEGNMDEALTAFTQALAADQTSPQAQQALIARGNLYLARRQYDLAFNDFDKAVTIGENADAHNGRLQAALAEKKYDAAVEDVNALLKATPDDKSLVLEKANLLIQTKKYDSVSSLITDSFIKGLTKDDDRAAALLYQGIAYYESRSFDKALTDLNDSLALKESALGRYYRALTFEAQRNYQDALTDYQWLAYWNNIYNYDFGDQVSTKIPSLQELLPTVTQTPSPTNTREPSPTRTPSPTKFMTPTRTPTYTRTPRGGATITDTPTDTETDTPVPSDTPADTETVTPSETATP